MDRINIDTSIHDRMMHRFGRYLRNHRPITTVDEDVDEESPSLCMEGKAVTFNEPIASANGEILVFEEHCFDAHLASGKPSQIWFSHDPTHVIGSTDTGLELIATSDFLAFRLPLTNGRYADTVREKITSGKQSAISVGITYLKERTEKVGQHNVIFIEEAELRETSLVGAGCDPTAFARLIDSKKNPPLRDSVHTDAFKIENGLHNVRSLQRQISNHVDDLKQRLAVLEASTPRPSPSLNKPRASWRETFLTDGRGAMDQHERLAAQHQTTHLF